MANLKEVRNRIISVNSTQQITKAMKMVSAAKLKRAVDASATMAPYAQKLTEMIENIGPELGDLQNIYAQKREVKKVLLVIVTSNRGLAGAFNSNIIRMAYNYIRETYLGTMKMEDIQILAIGKKGFEFFKRRGFTILDNSSDIFNDLKYQASSKIADQIMHGFERGDWDRVELFYNRFKNAALQFQEKITLLPVQNLGKELVETEIMDGKVKSFGLINNYIFEPSIERLVEYLVPESIRASVYSSLLSSFAAEHGARMTSMDKATDNAAELLRAYKLQYNRARQASITNEILEIVSGANALENAG